MAKQTGGIMGRPSGKVGGVVFGAARSRAGKVVTAREKVSPSNPNTVAQQAQRSIFSRALDIVKRIGPSIYQDDWNRAVSQLPGFQSIMSLVMANNTAGVFSAPADVSLGTLHAPDTINFTTGSSEFEIKATWSTEAGANGTAADELVFFLYPASEDTDLTLTDTTSVTRADGAGGLTFDTTVASEDFVCCVYLRGAGTADGLISLATFKVATSHA
jgi:hypothetical protein